MINIFDLILRSALVAATPSTASNAVPQSKCWIITVAKDHVANSFPFIDLTGRRAVISGQGNLWEVVFQLSEGTLGFVPIISIDKRTCLVVRAVVEQ